jgi:hypothetical protein
LLSTAPCPASTAQNYQDPLTNGFVHFGIITAKGCFITKLIIKAKKTTKIVVLLRKQLAF